MKANTEIKINAKDCTTRAKRELEPLFTKDMPQRYVNIPKTESTNGANYGGHMSCTFV